MSDILTRTANSPMEKASQLVELEALSRQIQERIQEYRADLLRATQELDVLSLKTGKYTISRVKRVTPRVTDFETLKKELDEANIPYETKEVFHERMNLTFKELQKANRELDGLDYHETEYISIRIKKGGEK